MMTKVTTKTKKAFLILAAVERGLFKNNMEASKNSNDALYKEIKEWDAQHEQQEQQLDVKAETSNEPKTEAKQESGKKKRLPPRKKAEPTSEPKQEESKVADVPEVEIIEYKDIRTFRYLMLNLIREKYDVNYAKLQLAKIPKKHYSHAIELLNESISNAMSVLGKVAEAEIVVHMVDKDGNVTDGTVLVSRDKVIETRSELEQVDKANDGKKSETDKDNLSKQNQQSNDKSADAKVEPKADKDEEDKKTADMIIASFGALKVELDEVRKDNDELKAKVRNLEADAKGVERREVGIHDELVNFMNKLANTKDEKYVWVWKELNSIVSIKLPRTEESPIVLDIEKLIIEDSIRMREEAEAQRILEEKKAKAMEEDTMYEGENVSYIDGKVVKPDGVKKRAFNAYKVWTDDCEEWVDYVIEKLAEADKQKVIPKRKKAIAYLKSELKDWYDEWAEACDEDAIDMVKDIMDELISSKSRNRDKAMSNLVAIVDGLEL